MKEERDFVAYRVQRGLRLRAIREERGWTQTEMNSIAKLRFGRIAYVNWERGTRSMSDEATWRLCKALKMTADYLIFGVVNDELERMTSEEFCDRITDLHSGLPVHERRSRKLSGRAPA